MDPNILENMARTGFAPTAHWEQMFPDDSDIVTEEGDYHTPVVPAGKDPSDDTRKKNYVKQFDCPPFMKI